MSIKAENTKEKILNTAKEHFLRDGLSGASLRNIVKDAGLTTGAFYKYYPTKESMFDALVDPFVEHIYQIYDDILAGFERLDGGKQTANMNDASDDGINQIVDYVYEHYDNFRLLLKCGDSGKFEDFIHGMVEREISSTLNYLETMKSIGMDCSMVDKSFMHMIYTGFFTAIFQIIEHDIDPKTAKKNISLLKQFQTGGWEKILNVDFSSKSE